VRRARRIIMFFGTNGGKTLTTKLNDKEFIFDPDRWPRWPLCPLRKHVGNFGDDDYCGFVAAASFTRVYIGLIYAVKPGRLSDALKEFRYVDYPDVDAMLKTWKVD